MPAAARMSQDEIRVAIHRLEHMAQLVENERGLAGLQLAQTVNGELLDIFGAGSPQYGRASFREYDEQAVVLRKLHDEIAALRARLPSASTRKPGPIVPGQPPFVQNNSIDVAAEIAARRPSDIARRSLHGKGVDVSGSMPEPLRNAATAIVGGAMPGRAVVNGGSIVLPVGEREAILARLSSVETLLRDLLPLVRTIEAAKESRDGIGGNNPPESIDAPPLDTAEIERGISAAKVIRTEISEQRPHIEAVRLSWLVLKQVAKGAVAFAGWLAGKGDKFCDAVVSSAGKTVGPLLVTGAGVTLIITALDRMGVDLAYVTEHVEQLLRAAGMH